MTKKQIKEKLKNQKGLAPADVLIALLMILTSIGIIGMVYLNMNVITRMTNAKAGATRIATNIIENVKGSYYDRVQDFNSSQEGAEQSIFDTKIPKGYKVDIKTEEFEADTNNLAKKVTINVMYNPNNDNEVISYSTIIEREIVRECNSPNFSEEYAEELVGEGKKYQMYPNVVAGKKIICPIKYNGEDYVVVTGNDLNGVWYSYSDRQWARALVFDNSTELNTYIDTSTGTVKDAGILKDENKSFVWVPRFKIYTATNKLYFMYKNTNQVISQYDANNMVYNYINASDSNLNDLEKFNEFADFNESASQGPLAGKWFNYYNIKNIDNSEVQDSSINKLYHSDYGSLFEI